MISEAGDPDGEDGLAELDELLHARFFERLARQLQGNYPRAAWEEVEDAVATACERLVKRLTTGPVRDVANYMAKVAFNELKRSATQPKHDELDDGHGSPVNSAERVALRNALLDTLIHHVRSWENINIREVTITYLEAAAINEPLEADEVAEIVGPILGEVPSAASVRKWKSRGFSRMREYLENSIENDLEFDDGSKHS